MSGSSASCHALPDLLPSKKRDSFALPLPPKKKVRFADPKPDLRTLTPPPTAIFKLVSDVWITILSLLPIRPLMHHGKLLSMVCKEWSILFHINSFIWEHALTNVDKALKGFAVKVRVCDRDLYELARTMDADLALLLKLASTNETIVTMGKINWGKYPLPFKSLPAHLLEIGEEVFMGCYDMPLEALPPKLKCIGTNAFTQCQRLILDTLPPTLETIRRFAFSFCTGIRALDFSGCKALCAIEEGVFTDCTSLRTVNLSYCTSLLSIGRRVASRMLRIASCKLRLCMNVIASATLVRTDFLATCFN
jgi:hypothetical protein